MVLKISRAGGLGASFLLVGIAFMQGAHSQQMHMSSPMVRCQVGVRTWTVTQEGCQAIFDGAKHLDKSSKSIWDCAHTIAKETTEFYGADYNKICLDIQSDKMSGGAR